VRRRIEDPVSTRLIEPYRELVKAHPHSRAKAFIWQIVRSNGDVSQIKVASTDTYKTMHEAYAAGAAVLKNLSST
jgi:hypothetical protein